MSFLQVHPSVGCWFWVFRCSVYYSLSAAMCIGSLGMFFCSVFVRFESKVTFSGVLGLDVDANGRKEIEETWPFLLLVQQPHHSEVFRTRNLPLVILRYRGRETKATRHGWQVWAAWNRTCRNRHSARKIIQSIEIIDSILRTISPPVLRLDKVLNLDVRPRLPTCDRPLLILRTATSQWSARDWREACQECASVEFLEFHERDFFCIWK